MGKEQELLAAAKTGDIQQVRKLLSKLRKTVSSSKLEASADVGKDGKFKKNPKKSAKLLNVNAADDNCFTALHHSALLDKADICRELIDVEATVDLKDKNGMTPLHLAAWAGRVEQASLLLRSGADSNSLSSNGETALILTAQYGKTDVASLLLGNKADVGAIAFGGSTALDKACQFGHLEMVELLVKSGALKYVKPLSNADKKDPNKHTPLHLAAKHGHVEIIRALLSYGVDVNLETANGTSLHEAALYGRKDIVKLLVECGVDVNRRNLYQQTSLDIVLHFVKSAAAKEMKEILIESGCANVVLARANFDYHVADSTMLSLCEGQIIAVLEQNANGRWKGSVGEGETANRMDQSLLKWLEETFETDCASNV
ncbi:caskin-2-like isoform X2 [Corticium candelabrum]|uniref:caskin-2-like isoform X2 n=1 Tax=Corticium candelabrum TaxID=121492 RepID=UPI002E36BB03|nr:caskin-2-like isoform X2 [Corticium candelabrum]